jgi:hypothetical protein
VDGVCLKSQLLGKWESGGGLPFEASPSKKVSETASQPTSQAWWLMSVMPTVQ